MHISHAHTLQVTWMIDKVSNGVQEDLTGSISPRPSPYQQLVEWAILVLELVSSPFAHDERVERPYSGVALHLNHDLPVWWIEDGEFDDAVNLFPIAHDRCWSAHVEHRFDLLFGEQRVRHRRVDNGTGSD